MGKIGEKQGKGTMKFHLAPTPQTRKGGKGVREEVREGGNG